MILFPGGFTSTGVPFRHLNQHAFLKPAMCCLLPQSKQTAPLEIRKQNIEEDYAKGLIAKQFLTASSHSNFQVTALLPCRLGHVATMTIVAVKCCFAALVIIRARGVFE